MEFDFSSDQKQLRDQVRRFLGDRCDRAAVRRVLDTDTTHDAGLWKGLGDLGYLGAAIPETYGGLGAGYLELCVIAEELGRVVAPVPFSSSIALAAEMLLLAGSETQKQRWLPRLASGEAIGTLALDEESGPLDVDRLQSRVAKGRLSGTKIAVPEGSIAHLAIVAARDEAGAPSLFVADLAGSGVHRDSVSTIDPTRDHATLRFDGMTVEPLGASGAAGALIRTVRDRAAVLVAFEQLGGADRALEMARDYALERFAFGRPIGSLQAIKHMLADMYVSATLARSNAYYGAWALSTNAEDLPTAAATARVSATQAYQHCARNNIQVHGGMGFTWEFDCHLHYRRSNLLALALGSLSAWENRLIDTMVNA